jgi:ankyrin repeat protein
MLLDLETSPEAYESFPDPGFALPGDFLTAHTRSCADFPGQQHGKGDCWCSIAQETSVDPNSWLLSTGELSGRARHVLEHPSPANAAIQDSFGNTPLHLFAALPGYQETLFRMVVNSGSEGLRATNTAGQTFLHVLNLEWFTDVTNSSAPLRRLLAHITECCPDAVYETDVYGRTFFHRAHSLVRDPSLLASLVSLFNPELASRRDAFGFNPVTDTDPASHSPYIPPRRTGSLSPQVEDLARSSPNSRPHSSSSEGSFLAYHARLVQVIQSSYTNPRIEDAEGRNGLHCLAEAILNQQTMDRHVRSSSSSSSTSAPNRPHNNLKRKLPSKDTTTTTPSPSPKPTPTSATTEATLPTRLRHLHSLLHPSVAVSPAHYNHAGTTPLMAFIEHIPDEHDDKAKTLQTILETLIRAGGTRSVEARNRRGETALLVAARLGRKVALVALLEGGARVGVRDVEGRGVLEVIDAVVRGGRARGEVGLYARLEACRVLLTGRREWGVGYAGEGGVVREWR